MTDTTQCKDATVHGTLDLELLAETIEISMSNSGKETFRGGWTTQTMTVKELLESLAQHPVGQKDGTCFLQGAVVGGVRSSAATKHADLLVLDLDQGEKLEAVHEKVRKLGKMCVVYTTHSFGKCVSPIKRDALIKFTGGEGDVDPTLDDAISYLLTTKGYEPSVLEGAELLETEHTTEGVTVRVKHQPMPKARLVFVLEKRFSFSTGGTQKDLIALWKERYAGAARTLGVAIDRSCTDPSRLFYSPRHAKGAKFQVDIFAGDFLDLEQMPRVTSQDLRDENPFTKAAKSMGAGNAYQTESLIWFFGKHGPRFDVADFLLETDPDGDRGTRATGAGRIHQCPNDSNHSDAGNPEDKGFFCINGLDSETEQAVAKCMHASCSTHDRADLVDLACQAAGITNATELLKWVPELVEEAKEEEEAKEPLPPEPTFADIAAARATIAALPKDDDDAAIDVARKVGATDLFSPAQVDGLMKDLKKKSGLGVRSLEAERKKGEALRPKVSTRQSAHSSLDDNEMVRLAQWNKKYAVVTLGGKVRILQEPRKAGSMPAMFELDAFKALEANQKVLVDDNNGGVKQEALTKLWLEWADRRTYRDGVVFEPDGCNADSYNLWRGFPVVGKAGEWGLLRHHILANICQGNEEHFVFLITWLAQMFQQPSVKLGSAVAIKGRKGAGKSKLFDWVRKAMGHLAIQVTTANHITGNFNSHHAGKILMVCEEAFWAGSKTSLGPLKSLITSNTSLLERKGVDPIQVSNYLRLVFISNEEWVVPVQGEDERRFFVLECGEARLQDTRFFAAVDRQMENGGLEAMVDELMKWTPPDGDWGMLRSPPKGEAHKAQAVAGLEYMGSILLRLAQGETVFAKGRSDVDGVFVHLVEGRDASSNVCCELDGPDLRAVLETHQQGHGGISGRALLQGLRLVFGDVTSVQSRDGVSRRRTYRIPHSLDEIIGRAQKDEQEDTDVRLAA